MGNELPQDISPGDFVEITDSWSSIYQAPMNGIVQSISIESPESPVIYVVEFEDYSNAKFSIDNLCKIDRLNWKK